MVLSSLKANRKCRVKNISGGGFARRRLHELGFIAGAEVKVVKNDFGPVIVSLSGNKLAIGRGLASHIVVDSE
ncbi:MAG: FeoA family protein [Gudongella sp.]|jgi:Fe2+ transport system protein FeoA|nr:FeoA family protein [Gudongella sp.]